MTRKPYDPDVMEETMARTRQKLIADRLRTGPLPPWVWPCAEEVRLLPIRTPADRRRRMLTAHKWAVDNVRHADGHTWSVRTDMHQDDDGRRYDVPVYWFSDLTTACAFKLQFGGV